MTLIREQTPNPIDAKNPTLYAPCRQEAARAALALAAAEEEAMALRIEAEVRIRVAAAIASPEVQARIEARLREERTALEQKARVATCRGC